MYTFLAMPTHRNKLGDLPYLLHLYKGGETISEIGQGKLQELMHTGQLWLRLENGHYALLQRVSSGDVYFNIENQEGRSYFADSGSLERFIH